MAVILINELIPVLSSPLELLYCFLTFFLPQYWNVLLYWKRRESDWLINVDCNILFCNDELALASASRHVLLCSKSIRVLYIGYRRGLLCTMLCYVMKRFALYNVMLCNVQLLTMNKLTLKKHGCIVRKKWITRQRQWLQFVTTSWTCTADVDRFPLESQYWLLLLVWRVDMLFLQCERIGQVKHQTKKQNGENSTTDIGVCCCWISCFHAFWCFPRPILAIFHCNCFCGTYIIIIQFEFPTIKLCSHFCALVNECSLIKCSASPTRTQVLHTCSRVYYSYI